MGTRLALGLGGRQQPIVPSKTIDARFRKLKIFSGIVGALYECYKRTHGGSDMKLAATITEELEVLT